MPNARLAALSSREGSSRLSERVEEDATPPVSSSFTDIFTA